MAYQEIIEYLKNLANPGIAIHSQKYFKTGKGEYGEGDIFLGIRVPILRKSIKQFKETSLADIQRLLKSEYHEIRLFTLLLLVEQFSSSDDGKKEKIYNLYMKNTKHINNWDLVDSSAHKIIGAYLMDKNRSILYKLAESKHLWSRRIAIISTAYFISNNQYTDTLKISEKLLTDNEDLIHKAVGWMLREVGKRDKSIEEKFLKKHYKKMPRTMLRYAIEKFSPAERNAYLKDEL